MLEASDQNQTQVLPQSPLPETPSLDSPSLDGPSQDESALTAEIAQLWQIHSDYKTSIKHQSDGLRTFRSELGKLLLQMKRILARPGRGGEWSGWLKQRKISRATADRLVGKYERSLNPDGNRLNESISEPTEEQIQTLLNKFAPKLRRVLRTPQSVYRFVDLMTTAFAVNRKDTGEGFVVVKPPAHMAVEQPVPEEAQVEPVPVISDVQVEGDCESMEISAA